MNAKAAVTASMIYLGILVVLSQGWMAKISGTVSGLSGRKP